jgi:hypothetical protein
MKSLDRNVKLSLIKKVLNMYFLQENQPLCSEIWRKKIIQKYYLSLQTGRVVKTTKSKLNFQYIIGENTLYATKINT